MIKEILENLIFWTILDFAVGAMMIVGGIWAVQGGGDFAADAVRSVFSGRISEIAGIAFGAVEILSGVFIILRSFFRGRFSSILKFAICIIWLAAIVLSDFMHGNFLKPDFLNWIYEFSKHSIVFGALLVM